jgi:hypothetical protein
MRTSAKYVNPHMTSVETTTTFSKLICEYPRYVTIEQESETLVSIKLEDEHEKTHQLSFTAHTERRQQDGLTSNVLFLDEPLISVSHDILQEEEKTSVTLNMRVKAMWCCIWFGTMPYRVYEKTCHYRRGYLGHLKLNWGTVWMWVTSGQVRKSFVDFENETNSNWIQIFKNMFGGLK